MFKTFPKTVFLAFILVVGLANATAYGQYKKIYSIDRPDLMEPNLFSATKVLETNLPGRRIAISGTLNVQDTSFFTYQSIYDLLTDLHGNPTGMHLYEDTSSFLFQGPRGYSACYDGNGHFYHAIGSNNRQVVMKTDTAGNVLWANTQNHHEFYSIVCENSGVVYLGQDESIQGAHDFSLARMDENGTASQGNMFGTIDFEQPYKVIRDGNHYVMAGSSFKQTGFYLMIVKADMNFQTVWGRVTRSPGKDMNCTAVASAADGSGYIFSGRARGGADSVFVMKTDTAGNTVWMKLFNIGGATEAHNSSIAVVPGTGDYLVAGYYRGVQYYRPYVMCLSPTGSVKWIRDYGDSGINTDEVINDIIYNSIDDYFYAVGDYIKVESQISYRIFAIKALPLDGLTTCDSVLTAASRDIPLEPDSPIVTEPFLANSPHPVGPSLHPSMAVETRCSVLVAVEEPLENKARDFHFLNPSDGTLQIQVEIPVEGATLKVYDLSGKIVFEKHYEAGFQKEALDLRHLNAGIYLVAFSGDEWRVPAKRWVVQH